MRLFRRRAEFAILALLALGVQLVTAFGHTHQSGIGHQAAALAPCAIVPPADTHPSPAPHDHEPGCATCLALGVAGSLILPDVPRVIRPPLARGLALSQFNRIRVPVFQTAAFEARGPPPPART